MGRRNSLFRNRLFELTRPGRSPSAVHSPVSSPAGPLGAPVDIAGELPPIAPGTRPRRRSATRTRPTPRACVSSEAGGRASVASRSTPPIMAARARSAGGWFQAAGDENDPRSGDWPHPPRQGRSARRSSAGFAPRADAQTATAGTGAPESPARLYWTPPLRRLLGRSCHDPWPQQRGGTARLGYRQSDLTTEAVAG